MSRTRLERKKQVVAFYQQGKKYSIFQGIDRVFMATYRLNEKQFNYLTHVFSDEETNLFFTNELSTFSEKRSALTILQSHMINYQNQQ